MIQDNRGLNKGIKYHTRVYTGPYTTIVDIRHKEREIRASDWLRHQFLAVVLAFPMRGCVCTLSAFYHMAKQHSKGVSTQATDKTV